MAEETAARVALFNEAPKHWGFFFTNTTHRDPPANTDPSKVTLSEGYTALVTGASYGLGEYIAKAFAQARVTNIIINSRTTSSLERVKKELESIASQSGRKINVGIYAGDASKAETYSQLRTLLEAEYNGRLDALICNAGGGEMPSGWGKIHEMDPVEVAKINDLNYMSQFYAAQALIPVMLNPQSKGRTIVNLTSGSSHIIGFSPLPYNISKLAVNRLTQAIGETYAEDGLVAVALQPGAAMTPGAEKLPYNLKECKCSSG